MLGGAEVRSVARVATGQITSARITPGTRLPAYATSMGRVLLADLPRAPWPERIRSLRPQALTPHALTSPEALTAAFAHAADDGFVLAEQEFEAGVRSLAYPSGTGAGAPSRR
ncbi:IclR family transcriptional regulator domain-containing protein [Streptomyces mirabilis]|uniref:Transcriptional regulator n=1 Tax=Streptomyces mirabilis TaxID=68239 RepID=A0A1I2NCW7_9ACTN|nr:transcriptional regulator [Streptomyces mirabilis]